MNPEAKPAIPPCASVLGVEIEDDDSMVEFFEKYLQGLRAKEVEYRVSELRGKYEQLRGPVPRWYEMYGAEFTYEAAKNREFNKAKQKRYQEYLDYIRREISAPPAKPPPKETKNKKK